jgi:hypothetical protein
MVLQAPWQNIPTAAAAAAAAVAASARPLRDGPRNQPQGEGSIVMLRVQLLLCCALLFLPLQGRCDGDGVDPRPSPCPGAEAWKQAHPEDSADAMTRRDRGRSFTAPDLRGELQ